MQNNFYPLLITFLAYILIIYMIGYWATLRTKNLSDYVLGGRQLSGPVAALAAGASDMSSWLLMALPGAFLVKGMNQIWLPIALFLGAYFNWSLVAKRLRIYSELANDSLTIPAYLDNRFQDESKVLRVVTAVVILIFFTAYAAAGFISGALLTQATFQLEYETALWISATVIVIYTAIGGFLAISWIDFFQGSLMFIALLVVPAVTLYHLGSPESVINSIELQNINLLNPFSKFTWVSFLALFGWGLGYFGQPHILVRFMAVKTPKDIPLAKRICMGWMGLALIGASITGLLGIVYFAGDPLREPETVFIQLAQILFNPWIAGILLAAVLSAIMSTISAQLIASSSVLVEDFYRTFLRKKGSDKEYLAIGRVSVFLIALIAICVARDPDSTVMQAVEYAWSGLGAAFAPVILISLYWRRMTRNGAIGGMIVGTVTAIFWHRLAIAYGGIFECGNLLPGFLFNSITLILISLLDTRPKNLLDNKFSEFQSRLAET
jgi:sodium/proline symporter